MASIRFGTDPADPAGNFFLTFSAGVFYPVNADTTRTRWIHGYQAISDPTGESTRQRVIAEIAILPPVSAPMNTLQRRGCAPGDYYMLKSQKLTIELSEKRQRLNALLEKSDLSSEEKSERESLTNRLQEIEPELRAAITAEAVTETTDPAENAELRGACLQG